MAEGSETLLSRISIQSPSLLVFHQELHNDKQRIVLVNIEI